MVVCGGGPLKSMSAKPAVVMIDDARKFSAQRARATFGGRRKEP